MEKIIEVLENNNWYVRQNTNFILIEQWSDLGEDLVEEIGYKTKEDFIKEFERIVNCFDVDEHVEMYVNMRGRRGVPNCTIKELLEDAEKIKKIYETTLKEIKEIEEE